MRSSARDKKLTQLAGEHAVASELARRGWVPMVMPENWPGFDIMAQSEDGSELYVQVKTRYAKTSYAIVPRGACPHAVVFVQVWDDNPTFFLVPGAEVERMRDERFEENLLHRPNASPNQADHPIMKLRWTDLEPYRGRWDLVLGLGD